MKKLLIIIAIIVVFFGLYKLLSMNPTEGVSLEEATMVLFWGNGCPHCEKVEKYIKDNKLDKIVKISYKEVYYNTANQKLLDNTVKKCPEIDTANGIGVPLAFDKFNSKCYYGDQAIIDWLKTKMLK